MSFSQTTYPRQLNDSIVEITTLQLKQTNLIFSEHRKLKLENTELYKQLDYSSLMIKNAERKDQLNREMISSLRTNLTETEEYYKAQVRIQERRYNTLLTIGSVGVTVTIIALIVCLR